MKQNRIINLSVLLSEKKTKHENKEATEKGQHKRVKKQFHFLSLLRG